MSTRADEIRRRMFEVRSEIDDDVEELVEGAKSLVDWRDYVRSFPLASIGVACAVGFLAIPGRSRNTVPNTETLARALKQNNLFVPSGEAKSRPTSWISSLASSATSTLGSAAMRAAAAYLGQQAASKFAGASTESDSQPTPTTSQSS